MTETQLLERVRQLRDKGRSPKEIARSLGVPRSTISPFVQRIAEERSADAPEAELLGCWVSPGWSNGLGVDGTAGWPGIGVDEQSGSGLVAVLVARRHRYGRASVCGYLVDTWCLGVKDVLGPRIMNEAKLEAFVERYFGAYDADPIDAPIELAQHLVRGGVDFARGLGFEPHEDFGAVAMHLGAWVGPSAITFGENGKPCYIQGPFDDPDRYMDTLEGSVGNGNFHFTVQLA